MASGLKDLTQHVLGDAGVQASHIQGAFVRLGRGAARDIARSSAGRRHDVRAHGGADGRRDGVRVLRDDDGREWRRGHVLLGLAGSTAIVARCTGRGRRRRHLRLCGCRVGHGNYSRRTRRRQTGRVRGRGRGGQEGFCEVETEVPVRRRWINSRGGNVHWRSGLSGHSAEVEEGRRQGNKRTGRRDPKTPECGKERKGDRKRAGKTRSDTDAKGR